MELHEKVQACRAILEGKSWPAKNVNYNIHNKALRNGMVIHLKKLGAGTAAHYLDRRQFRKAVAELENFIDLVEKGQIQSDLGELSKLLKAVRSAV